MGIDENIKISVNYIAKLANLVLEESEKQLFEKQLNDILKFFRRLEKVDIGNVTTENPALGDKKLRSDEPSASLSQEEVLSNATNRTNGFFTVKGIFGEV